MNLGRRLIYAWGLCASWPEKVKTGLRLISCCKAPRLKKGKLAETVRISSQDSSDMRLFLRVMMQKLSICLTQGLLPYIFSRKIDRYLDPPWGIVERTSAFKRCLIQSTLDLCYCCCKLLLLASSLHSGAVLKLTLG